jgi:sensor histidine kinase YesM
MTPRLPTQKLFKTAFYTSAVLVGVFAIAPYIGIFRSSSHSSFFNGMLSVALLILLLWLINIFLVYIMERFVNKKRITLKRYLLSYLACFLCILAAKPYIDSFVHNPRQAPAHLHIVFILGLVLNSVVLIIQDLIILKDRKSKVELENAELKLKNVEATNQQLKQQIHPHFLFNSLSTLKTLIKKSPVQAEDYLSKLSDFLRAALSSTTPNTVNLGEEIQLCHNYLDMQKMRFGQSLNYTISIPAAILTSESVPVFSILPLLENAIKHNKFTNELPLYITVTYENGWLTVSNNLSPKESPEHSTGLGLENLSERYRILSGDKIMVSNDGKTFSVSIKTLNDENSNNRR